MACLKSVQVDLSHEQNLTRQVARTFIICHLVIFINEKVKSDSYSEIIFLFADEAKIEDQ